LHFGYSLGLLIAAWRVRASQSARKPATMCDSHHIDVDGILGGSAGHMPTLFQHMQDIFSADCASGQELELKCFERMSPREMEMLQSADDAGSFVDAGLCGSAGLYGELPAMVPFAVPFEDSQDMSVECGAQADEQSPAAKSPAAKSPASPAAKSPASPRASGGSMPSPMTPNSRRRNNARSAQVSRERQRLFLRMVVLTLQSEHKMLGHVKTVLQTLLKDGEWAGKRRLVEDTLTAMDATASDAWKDKMFNAEMRTHVNKMVDGVNTNADLMEKLRLVQRRL
jgi:hypothetical protein